MCVLMGKKIKYLYIDLCVTDFWGDELLLKVKNDPWSDGGYIYVYPLGIRDREETNETYIARVNVSEINAEYVRLIIDLRKNTCSKIKLDHGRIVVSM
jgi:hypothetical protein